MGPSVSLPHRPVPNALPPPAQPNAAASNTSSPPRRRPAAALVSAVPARACRVQPQPPQSSGPESPPTQSQVKSPPSSKFFLANSANTREARLTPLSQKPLGNNASRVPHPSRSFLRDGGNPGTHAATCCTAHAFATPTTSARILPITPTRSVTLIAPRASRMLNR